MSTMLENQPETISLIRQWHREKKRSSEILRALANMGLGPVEMMSSLREAFGLDFDDVSCIGGWWIDGSPELDDRDIDQRLGRAIAQKFSG